MADKTEYEITTSWLCDTTTADEDLPVPEPPEGDGWVLVSSVPVPSAVHRGLVFYWTWSRTFRAPLPECPNPRCRSIAQKNGVCVGCGTPFGMGN